MSTLRLIVGLGNPGDQYARTRHNAGFWWVESLAEKFSIAFSLQNKFSGLTARIQHAGYDCFLLLPTTFMNRSGVAVKAVTQFYQIPMSQVLVAHDEIDLPAGVVRFKQGGGHGGHNGLRDIIAHCGADFWRCRIGVGHPGHKNQVLDYVLHAPSQAERKQIQHLIDSSLGHVDDIMALNMQKVMNQCH